MKRLLAVLFMMVALNAMALGDNLSPRAFTLEIAKAIRAAAPSATVRVERELEIEILYSNGQRVTATLGTAYNIYSKEPERLKSVIERHVSGLSKPPAAGQAAAKPKLDHSRIVPVVKTRKWLDDTNKEIKTSGAQQEQLVENFNDELLIAYAEDNPKAFRYLTTKEYTGNPAELRELALKNLLRVLPKIEQRIYNEHVSSISAGDDYTSSLLLVDHIWSGGQIKVQGDIVVAIPARDAILVTGSRDPMLKNFRALAADLQEKDPHWVTDTLFVYRNKRFTKFVGN
jgi:uncharacterized protein YtpQ (UPF0354 family)